MRGVSLGFWVVLLVVPSAIAAQVEEVPPPFQPFEHMIGGWKGTASPTANRVKGWQESHGWAWKFEKGRPVGLTLSFEGDKALTKGSITFDPASRKYKLDGLDAEGKPVAYVGAFSPDGKTLALDRVGATAEGKERLIVRPNSNKIRYTLNLDRQEPGAPQYKTVFTVGLTKDGESFAAGAGGADLPKCIMTGGAAGIIVSYQGKSYPVCCTGCRDEFNDNPEKYAKLADAAAAKASTKAAPGAKEQPAAKGKDDGSFDGLIDEPRTKKGVMPARVKAKAEGETKVDAPPVGSKPEAAKDDASTKAARNLQLGQNYEKGGKKALALDYYRKVVKDQPDGEAAKTAAARLKALEGK